MGSKYVIIVIAIAALVLLGIGIVKTTQGNKGDGSSTEDSITPVMTDIVVANMPSRLHIKVPEGFTETSSKGIEKYYIRNDASLIVTGEKQPGIGSQLDYFIQQVKQSYEATADEFTLLNEEIISVDNGQMPCGLLEFTFAIIAPDKKQQMQCLTGLFVKDDYVYVITCKSYVESFSNYRQLFRSAIQSVTIDDEEIPPDAVIQGEPALTTAIQTAVSSLQTEIN